MSINESTVKTYIATPSCVGPHISEEYLKHCIVLTFTGYVFYEGSAHIDEKKTILLITYDSLSELFKFPNFILNKIVIAQKADDVEKLVIENTPAITPTVEQETPMETKTTASYTLEELKQKFMNLEKDKKIEKCDGSLAACIRAACKIWVAGDSDTIKLTAPLYLGSIFLKYDIKDPYETALEYFVEADANMPSNVPESRKTSNYFKLYSDVLEIEIAINRMSWYIIAKVNSR